MAAQEQSVNRNAQSLANIRRICNQQILRQAVFATPGIPKKERPALPKKESRTRAIR
jgi:hypothetical protein